MRCGRNKVSQLRQRKVFFEGSIQMFRQCISLLDVVIHFYEVYRCSGV